MTPPQPRAHIYLSSNHWDGLWIIQQPIVNEIAREEPILYVEQFASIFSVLRSPSLWRRLFTWMRGARRVNSRLRVLAPLPLFHLGHRVPWLFRLEFLAQRWWIRRWAKADCARVRVVWLDNPMYECAIGRLGEDLAIYHVADEVSAFPTSHARTMERLERKTLQKVGVVFAAAQQLADDKRQVQANTHTVWNAIDPSVFAAQGQRPTTASVALDRIPAPRVAFIGVLDQWVDLDLLALAAARLPRVHFVLAGPSRVPDAPLRNQANVHFLGRIDRGEVPGVLRACSASLVPFKRTKLTERIVPLKVFEALAAGILPVCTDFSPDLHVLERDGHVRIGRTGDGFVAALQQAIQGDTPAERARLALFGGQQTWRARWDQMRSALADALARRPTS